MTRIQPTQCIGPCQQHRLPCLFQCDGLAVVSDGVGLHLPIEDETHDLPVIAFDEPPVTPFSVANELRWLAEITARCLLATAVVVAWALVVHFVNT